ncbi:MAG TPA: alpha-glucan family phosphorylase [Nitrospirae bacterium]|nr:glycogen phosphorylase [bacterium BMS3Abin06]HDH12644.1 alpha-glucan family phosphorylase [Nitrospirota bacterium]HDY99910.1 alpha-glucan family phosphorylase [Nitrospirota bacterium]
MSILEKHITEPKIAYFSMEIGLRDEIPTYSGGLGVLAGDTVKSAADLELPFVAVTLISRKGYFRQEIDNEGRQKEFPAVWEPSKLMTLMPEKVTVRIEGRTVHIRAWVYFVESPRGGIVPVIYLDTDLPENSTEDRTLTDSLYGGDESYRIKQEVILGIGGVRMLRKLGFRIKKYHMNEGHAAFLTLELLHEYKKDIEAVWDEEHIWDVEAVKNLCVFTTHTPVEAGHDRFTYELFEKVFGDYFPENILKKLAGEKDVNMTLLGFNLSNHVNGVAKKHGEVSQGMFPGYQINAITNGVHSFTWTSAGMKKIFDKYLPGWANEPEIFVRIGVIPDEELWNAHMEAKKNLIDYVNSVSDADMDYETLTIGFARRATAYKRADLLFSDLKRLEKIGTGNIQVIYAGKAHPKDTVGKQLIEKIFSYKRKLKGKIKIAFIQNYNMEIALKLVSGVDIWLNTPLRPLEASGTSGMKAAHNGVMNFSVLDGWWIEGHIEGYTGWSIGPAPQKIEPDNNMNKIDADDLYNKLEKTIIPLYYNDRKSWIRMMQNAIGKNAYYFNTHRMMRRYVTEAYIR